MTLAQRRLEPELMDQPGLDPKLHAQALRGLARVNLLSRNAATLWNRIRPLAANVRFQPLRVLDLACGGGDTAIALARKAAQAKIPLQMAGCDRSPTAISHAQAAAKTAGCEVDFFNADVVDAALPEDYDVICCSLFLHHLSEDQAIRVLRSMRESTRQMVLVSDLSRNRLGYLLAWVGIRLLSRSHICHVDGPLSVSAAFTPAEAQNLARQAGLEGSLISYQWPQRFLLQWSKP